MGMSIIISFIFGVLFGNIAIYITKKLTNTFSISDWKFHHYFIAIILTCLMISIYIMIRMEMLGVSGR